MISSIIEHNVSKSKVQKMVRKELFFIYITIFFWFLIGLLSPTYAQRYTYKHYTSLEGLPSSEVYEVIQDKKGFMWFCTDHGISRYDGYSFKNFSTGLSDNTIFRMVEDETGIFWCETFSKGLFLFDGKGFTPYKYNDSLFAILEMCFPKTQRNNPIRTLFLGGNNKIILSFFNGEVVQVGINSFERIKKFVKPECNVLNLNTLPRLLIYKNYLLTDINRAIAPNTSYSKMEFSDLEVKIPFKEHYTNIAEIASGFTFLMINDSLFIVDKAGNINLKNKLKARFVRANKINEQTMALGYQDGGEIYTYQNGKWKLTYTLLNEHIISGFCKDMQGNMWLTTTDDGVYMMANLDVEFLSIGTDSLTLTTTITEDKLSSKDKKSASKSNKVSLTVPKIPHSYKLLNLDYKAITMKYIEGNVWLATDKNDFYRISPDEKKPYFVDKKTVVGQTSDVVLWKNKIFTNLDLMNELKSKRAIKYMALQNDTLWLCSIFGLERAVNGKYDTSFHAAPSSKSRLTALCATKKKLWVGTLSGIYFLRKNELVSVNADAQHKDVRVSCIVEDKNGAIWVGTRGHGIMVQLKNGKWFYITKKNGLPTDFVEDINFEKEGRAWISTYSGLVKLAYQYKDEEIAIDATLFTSNDGLPINEVSKTLIIGKELWIATNKGVAIAPLDSLYNKPISIPLFIESININGQYQPIQTHYELNPNQQHFAVFLTGLFLKDGQQLKYIYELSGEVTHIDTSENRLLQFYNLHAGNYKLTIYAYHPQKKILSAPKIITFRVNPPFTQTFLFYFLVFITTIGFMLGIFYVVYRNQNAQNQIRMEMVQWEQKALRAQMNPHFIFNVLNSIQAYIWENDRENAMKFLGKFSNLIRKTLQHSRYPSISLANELSTLELFLELEKFRMGKDLNYKIEIDAEINPDKTQIPPIIFQPLAENSIWHGIMKSPRVGEIRISIKKESNLLIGIIADNGVGLSKKTNKNVPHESIGLKNIEARLSYFATQNGGNLQFSLQNKTEGEGCIFTFSIPLIVLNEN